MTQQSTTAQTPKESSVETSSIEATEDVMAAVKVPLTRVRKAVAKAMTFSATVPQFAVERAIQTQAMFDLRKDLPTTISVGDLINAAIVRALVEHPRVDMISLTGDVATEESDTLAFAVALQPIKPNALGPCVFTGVTTARVYITNETDTTCELAAEQTVLASTPMGGIPILWKEEGTGEKWAVLELGRPSPGRVTRKPSRTSCAMARFTVTGLAPCSSTSARTEAKRAPCSSARAFFRRASAIRSSALDARVA